MTWLKPAPGYVPRPKWYSDVRNYWLGEPNVLKRLCHDDIFEALNLKKDDVALDFGCGSGYLTYDIARRCRKAVGLDVIDVSNNYIPEELVDRLAFVRQNGENTPFESETFDVILMSEVLLMIPDPRNFMAEAYRILRSGGRVVLVNPVDRRGVREFYERNGLLIRLLKQIGRAPKDYVAYTEKLQQSFKTAFRALPNREYYEALLGNLGYHVEDTLFSPSAASQKAFEVLQFMALCFGLRTFGKEYFLLYPLFLAIDRLYSKDRGTTCIIVARKP